MITKKILTGLLFACMLTGNAVFAQSILPDSSNEAKNNLVLSYTLNIKSDKKNGIAESYNGAIKTIFLTERKARSRMVSLMRVQSIFYSGNSGDERITVVKESGKDSYKKNLTKDQWGQMNKKYEDAVYEFIEDSTSILNYNCKKAVIHLKDGKKIVAFYTTELSNNYFNKVEPAFRGIPGLVLQYEYENKDGKFIYTATNISFAVTGPEVYKIP